MAIFHMGIEAIYRHKACCLPQHEFNILLPAINMNLILQNFFFVQGDDVAIVLLIVLGTYWIFISPNNSRVYMPP